MQLTCGCGYILAANPAIVPETGRLLKDVVVVEFPLSTWLVPAGDLCHLDVSCVNKAQAHPVHIYKRCACCYGIKVRVPGSLPMTAMLSVRCWVMLPSALCAWKMSISSCRFGELTSSITSLARRKKNRVTCSCVHQGTGQGAK